VVGAHVCCWRFNANLVLTHSVVLTHTCRCGPSWWEAWDRVLALLANRLGVLQEARVPFPG
jgi:hypothetical protein